MEELKASGGVLNGHVEEVQKWPIAAEIASLVREMTMAKRTIEEQNEEVQELKAERSNMKVLHTIMIFMIDFPFMGKWVPFIE